MFLPYLPDSETPTIQCEAKNVDQQEGVYLIMGPVGLYSTTCLYFIKQAALPSGIREWIQQEDYLSDSNPKRIKSDEEYNTMYDLFKKYCYDWDLVDDPWDKNSGHKLAQKVAGQANIIKCIRLSNDSLYDNKNLTVKQLFDYLNS